MRVEVAVAQAMPVDVEMEAAGVEPTCTAACVCCAALATAAAIVLCTLPSAAVTSVRTPVRSALRQRCGWSSVRASAHLRVWGLSC